MAETKPANVYVFWSDEGFTPAGRAKASVCTDADTDDHECYAQIFGDTVEIAQKRAMWLAEQLNKWPAPSDPPSTPAAPPPSLPELIDRCYRQAEALGWTEKPPDIVEQVALIHSEASEALESFRNHEPLSWTDDKGKPQGVASEYADIVIRVAHYVKALGIDLQTEILRKLDYNMTRGYKHGGKAI